MDYSLDYKKLDTTEWSSLSQETQFRYWDIYIFKVRWWKRTIYKNENQKNGGVAILILDK